MISLRENGNAQPNIAELMGVSLSTVKPGAYDCGVNALRSKPTRRWWNENMTFEEEKAFLADLPRVQVLACY
jgi:hypothetical protein